VVARNTASENYHRLEINNSSSTFRNNTADRSLFEGFVIIGLGNSFRENTADSNLTYGIYCSGRQNQIVLNLAWTRVAHRDDGNHFVVPAYEILTAFLERRFGREPRIGLTTAQNFRETPRG